MDDPFGAFDVPTPLEKNSGGETAIVAAMALTNLRNEITAIKILHSAEVEGLRAQLKEAMDAGNVEMAVQRATYKAAMAERDMEADEALNKYRLDMARLREEHSKELEEVRAQRQGLEEKVVGYPDLGDMIGELGLLIMGTRTAAVRCAPANNLVAIPSPYTPIPSPYAPIPSPYTPVPSPYTPVPSPRENQTLRW